MLTRPLNRRHIHMALLILILLFKYRKFIHTKPFWVAYWIFQTQVAILLDQRALRPQGELGGFCNALFLFSLARRTGLQCKSLIRKIQY